MPYTVYISHSYRDRTLALELAGNVEETGAKPILPSEDITPGQNWLEEIRRNLRKCDEMVVILTKDSVASPWVNLEMGAAFGLHKRIVPLIVDVNFESLPPVVKALQVARYGQVGHYLSELRKRVRHEMTRAKKKMN